MKTILLPILLLVAGVSSITASLPAPVVQVKAAPTPAMKAWRECDYCHRLYPGHAENGHFVFDNHLFIRLTVTTRITFETCEYEYYHTIMDAVQEMRRRGGGRLIENDVAEPTPTPPAR